MMTITLTLNEIVTIVIAVAVVVMLGYLIKLLKTLTETAQRTNKILADAEIMSRIAADKTEKLEGVADDLVEGIGIVSGLIKGNQSYTKALTNVVNSIAGIKSILSDKDSGKKSSKNAKK
ncbi:MAG: hypothetical protein E7225_07205 [Clostridiales bacterium]|nr:hypothetical protein [Clostridiales bacterium]